MFFLILFSLEIFSQNKPLISIYLDDNNITIKCENAEIGDKKKINGKIYTVVNKSILVNMIKKENDVSCLCISKVKDLTGVIGNYYGIETNFNQDISSWDTSNLINMTGLFGQASKFNQDISGWNTKNVSNMDKMIRGASEFKIDLSRLCVESIITSPDQFTTETTNYPREYIPKWGTCP